MSEGEYRDIVPDRGPGRFRSKPVRSRTDLHAALGDAAQRLEHADGVVDITSISQGSIPARRWLVDDLIPMDNVTQFSGDGGLGKSLLLLQLAVSTCLNLPWLGRAIRNPGRVVALMCEDDQDELHRRLYDIACGYGCDIGDLAENLVLVHRVGQPNELMTFSRFGEEPPQETYLYKKLYGTVMAMGPALIILDSSHDLFIGNENDRTQVRQFVGAIRKLGRECGAASVLNSHPSLSGMQSGSGTSGSTAWHNAVRARIYLTRPEGQTKGNTRVLTTKKMNYASGEGEIALEWENGVFVCTDAVGTAQTSMAKIATGEALELVVAAIRDLCEQGTYPSPSDNHPTLYVAKVLSKRLELRGLDKRNLENLVQEGLRKGLLQSAAAPKSRKGKYRPVIVHAGFRVPSQAIMEFQAGQVPVTVATAAGNVTAPRPEDDGDDEPEELEDRNARLAPAADDDPPDEAYRDLEQYNRDNPQD